MYINDDAIHKSDSIADFFSLDYQHSSVSSIFVTKKCPNIWATSHNILCKWIFSGPQILPMATKIINLYLILILFYLLILVSCMKKKKEKSVIIVLSNSAGCGGNGNVVFEGGKGKQGKQLILIFRYSIIYQISKSFSKSHFMFILFLYLLFHT